MDWTRDMREEFSARLVSQVRQELIPLALRSDKPGSAHTAQTPPHDAVRRLYYQVAEFQTDSEMRDWLHRRATAADWLAMEYALVKLLSDRRSYASLSDHIEEKARLAGGTTMLAMASLLACPTQLGVVWSALCCATDQDPLGIR